MMKELLNEWKKYLVEQSGNQETTVDPKTGDITLSDDAYAGLVLRDLFYTFSMSTERDRDIERLLNHYKLENCLMYYSQYMPAVIEAREIYKILFDLIRSIKDQKLRRKLVVNYDSNNKYSTISRIVNQRLTATFDSDFWQTIVREEGLLLRKHRKNKNELNRFMIKDYKKDPQEVLGVLKEFDEKTKGCAELINSLKRYKKLTEMDDADDMKSVFVEMFVKGVTENPLNLPQLESFLGSLY